MSRRRRPRGRRGLPAVVVVVVLLVLLFACGGYCLLALGVSGATGVHG